MPPLALYASWLVVALHVSFALAESVGWSAMARRFGLTPEAAEHTRALALNQGAYNAGAAALLACALVWGDWQMARALLSFVAAMGVVGALSVRWTIFVLQSLPALLALALF